MTAGRRVWRIARASPACLAAWSLTGCCWLGGWTTPEGITRWQDTSPPKLSLREKAARYQARIEESCLTPEGVLRYDIDLEPPQGGARDESYGNLADGPFHTGIYLGSQALRYAATRDPAAREQAMKALAGLKTLMDVTGKRGLLARYIAPAGTIRPENVPGWAEDKWRRSPTIPALDYRGDVSKDQYAGFIFGLGTTLAVMEDPEARALVAALSSAAADHLIENGMQIIDADGEPTTYGNLAGRIAVVSIGVNALISLAIAKTAAVSTGEARYEAFYRSLVERSYVQHAYLAHFTVLGVGNRVNDNMAHLALYALLRLEKDPEVLSGLGEGDDRTWAAVKRDRNAFFAFVHASRSRGGDGREQGLLALREFPDDKVEYPVDLTRPGFDFPRAFLNTRKCLPRTTEGVPLYLRPRSSSYWASDPFRLVGNLNDHGTRESAGADYLVAYWMGRYHGFVSADE